MKMQLPNAIDLGDFHDVTGIRVFSNRIMIGQDTGVNRILDISRAQATPMSKEGEFGTVDFSQPEVPLEGMYIAFVKHVLIVPHNDLPEDFHTYKMLLRTEEMGNFLWTIFVTGKAPWLP